MEKEKSLKKESNKTGSSKTHPKNKFKRKDDKRNSVPWENDPSWYAVSDSIARDIASIPFNVIQGTKWKFPYKTKDGKNTDSLAGTPNIMNIQYTLYNGLANINAETDGINMAAKQLYTTIRKSNSGAKVYEAPDLMMYVLAMREVYALYFNIKRYIGIINTYTFMNRVFPDGILRACGWSESDIDDARANLAIYRGKLNILASKINSFAIPKYFKVFMRDAFTASYIFSDSTALTGQFYIMSLQGIRKWSSTGSAFGTSLVWEPLAAVHGLSALLGKLDEMLDILFYDTDVNTMAGDIVKAFGESGLYHVEDCPLDYSCVPVYDENVLNQIQNMTWVPIRELIQDNTELDVTQENQNIKSGFKINADLYRSSVGGATHPSYMINSHKDNPNYMDILEWTRMMNVLLDYEASETYIVGGAELYLDVEIYQQCGDEFESDTLLQSIDAYGGGDTIHLNQVAEHLKDTARLGVFDWHPFIYVVDYEADAGSGGYGLVTFNGDVKHCTLVDSEVIKRIHDAAIYALFYATGV